MSNTSWAVAQISKLLPLDEDSLLQIISYSESLPKHGAAEHLKGILGDTPQALEFITSFNQRRSDTSSSTLQTHQSPSTVNTQPQSLSEVPKPKPRKKQPAKNFNRLPEARRPDDYGNVAGGYMKKDEDDYMSTNKSKSKHGALVANTLALQEQPDAVQHPLPKSSTSSAKTTPKPSPRLPPSAAGPLISDSKSNSRTVSPAPKAKTKVNISGGTSMHGQSKTLDDLDYAIRALEVQTNPTLALSPEDNARRRCNCMATRHPLLEAAPNCLNCGKVICVKEGLGPCTFCEKPLLSSAEITSMLQVLREDRGKERMAANNATRKRAEVAQTPRAFAQHTVSATSSAAPSDSESEKLAAAKQHRDKLLNFQAHNARRTQIHDEAADFDTPDAGLNIWATPQDRAMQLKRQQKALREQEWNARPEYEKRKVVASIDLVGGKIVKRMTAAERPQTPESDDAPEDPLPPTTQGSKGAFSQNPLLGKMIRPIARIDDKGKEPQKERQQMWRRVQDDDEDNEQWILDGGVYGRRDNTVSEGLRDDEPECG